MNQLIAELRAVSRNKGTYAPAASQEEWEAMLKANVRPGDTMGLASFVMKKSHFLPDSLGIAVDHALMMSLGRADHRSLRTVSARSRVRREITGAIFRATETDETWKATFLTRIIQPMKDASRQTTLYNTCYYAEPHTMFVDYNGNVTLQCTVTMSEANDSKNEWDSSDSSSSDSDSHDDSETNNKKGARPV